MACPPPPRARGSHLSDARPAAPRPCLPFPSLHSGALRAAGGGAAAAAAAEPGRPRTPSLMVVCLHPAPDAAFVWVAPARLGAARPPRLPQPSLGRRGRAGSGAVGAARGRGLAAWGSADPGGARGAGGGAGPGPPPLLRLLPGSAASSSALREGEGEFGCQLGGVSEALLPGDAAALADTAASRSVPEPLRPRAPTRPLPGSEPREPQPLPPPPAPRSPTCAPPHSIPRYPSPVSHPPFPVSGLCHPRQPCLFLGCVNHHHPSYRPHPGDSDYVRTHCVLGSRVERLWMHFPLLRPYRSHD